MTWLSEPIQGTALTVVRRRGSQPLSLADLRELGQLRDLGQLRELNGCQVLLPVVQRETAFAVAFDSTVERYLRDCRDRMCVTQTQTFRVCLLPSVHVFMYLVPDLADAGRFRESFAFLSRIYDRRLVRLTDPHARFVNIIVPPTAGLLSEGMRLPVLRHLVEHNRARPHFVLPASEADRAMLRQMNRDDRVTDHDERREAECPICMETGPGALVTAACGHALCASCHDKIRESASPLCPFCRRGL